MKKILIMLMLGYCLASCGGSESADSKPTDLDRTDNDDTTLNTHQLPDSIRKDSADTAHFKNK
jgi:hypothetical protein